MSADRQSPHGSALPPLNCRPRQTARKSPFRHPPWREWPQPRGPGRRSSTSCPNSRRHPAQNVTAMPPHLRYAPLQGGTAHHSNGDHHQPQPHRAHRWTWQPFENRVAGRPHGHHDSSRLCALPRQATARQTMYRLRRLPVRRDQIRGLFRALPGLQVVGTSSAARNRCQAPARPSRTPPAGRGGYLPSPPNSGLPTE